MANNILSIDDNFDFDKLTLVKPNTIGAGIYFSKLLYNKENLVLQGPKCITKNGLVSTAKKQYMDILYRNSAVILLEWFENLQKKLIDLIYNDKNTLFEDDVEKDDIENLFIPTLKIFKGGKFYLFRANIQNNSYLEDSSSFKCYDEHLNEIDVNKIDNSTVLIPLFEFKGLKISSKNFSLEIELKQAMTIDSKNSVYNQCLIKPLNNNIGVSNLLQQNIESIQKESPVEQSDPVKKESEQEVTLEQSEPVPSESEQEVAVEQSDPVQKESEQEVSLEQNDTVQPECEQEVALEQSESVEKESEQETEQSDSIENNNKEAIVEQSELAENNNEEVNLLKEKTDLSPLEKSKFNLLEETEDEDSEEDSEDSDDNEDEQEEGLENMLDLEDNLREKNINYENLTKDEDYNLKTRNEIYYNLWNDARKKVVDARDNAIKAYLNAKNIKSTFLLDDIYEPNDFEEYLEKLTKE